MPDTCLICCQASTYFVLPPCNHKEICWKCCVKLLQGPVFKCPYCKDVETNNTVLFVGRDNLKADYADVPRENIIPSKIRSSFTYADANVAKFIESQLTAECPVCHWSTQSVNNLKRHLEDEHKRSYCQLCLEGRRCLLTEQATYTSHELLKHQREGQFQGNAQVLYHPECAMCKRRFYDLDFLRLHLKTSDHYRCDFCAKESLARYIYYKDVAQLKQHFAKSHFVCDMGKCSTLFMENVFTTAEALEMHKCLEHKKIRHGRVTYNAYEIIDSQGNLPAWAWDKIGFDLRKELQLKDDIRTEANNSFETNKPRHYNDTVDIREFYPALVDHTKVMTLIQIRDRLYELMGRDSHPSYPLKFVNVPLFCPFKMPQLYRKQIEQFLHSFNEPILAQSVLQLIFNQSYNFRDSYQFCVQLDHILSKWSPYCFFMVFPQLIRFMSDRNEWKHQLDDYYLNKLRQLEVNRKTIVHEVEKYATLFEMVKSNCQSCIKDVYREGNLRIDDYITYVTNLNDGFYLEQQEHLFFISASKMKNIYHMIGRTKVRHLPKLDWLLKLGLTEAKQKAVIARYSYSIVFLEVVPNSTAVFKKLTIQQLALLHAYSTVCIDAITQHHFFESNKPNPNPWTMAKIMLALKGAGLKPDQENNLNKAEIRRRQMEEKLEKERNNYLKSVYGVHPRQLPTVWEAYPETAKRESVLEKMKNQSEVQSWINIEQNVNINSKNYKKNLNKKAKKDNEEETEEFPSLGYEIIQPPQPKPPSAYKRKDPPKAEPAKPHETPPEVIPPPEPQDPPKKNYKKIKAKQKQLEENEEDQNQGMVKTKDNKLYWDVKKVDSIRIDIGQQDTETPISQMEHQESIINQIKNKRTELPEDSEIVIKRGKKGKKAVYERYELIG